MKIPSYAACRHGPRAHDETERAPPAMTRHISCAPDLPLTNMKAMLSKLPSRVSPWRSTRKDVPEHRLNTQSAQHKTNTDCIMSSGWAREAGRNATQMPSRACVFPRALASQERRRNMKRAWAPDAQLARQHTKATRAISNSRSCRRAARSLIPAPRRRAGNRKDGTQDRVGSTHMSKACSAARCAFCMVAIEPRTSSILEANRFRASTRNAS